MFRKAANETFDVADMGYGDGITSSRRLANAMSSFFNEYIQLSFHPKSSDRKQLTK